MRETTVRVLRHDFGSVMSWIEDGEKVQIRKRGRIIALLTPVPVIRGQKRRVTLDFLARLRKRDGGRVIPALEIQKVLNDNKGGY